MTWAVRSLACRSQIWLQGRECRCHFRSFQMLTLIRVLGRATQRPTPQATAQLQIARLATALAQRATRQIAQTIRAPLTQQHRIKLAPQILLPQIRLQAEGSKAIFKTQAEFSRAPRQTELLFTMGTSLGFLFRSVKTKSWSIRMSPILPSCCLTQLPTISQLISRVLQWPVSFKQCL